MKKFFSMLFIGGLSLVAISLAACQTASVDEVDDTTVVDESSAAIDSDRSYDDMWLSFGELSFYLPEGWKADDVESGDVAYISVPDATYDVQLKMTVKEEDVAGDPAMLITQQFETQVYQNPCGGAYACYIMTFLDEYNRSIAFQVESSQEPPADLDGVWSPGTEVTREELVEFLLGVALTPEN